MNSNWRGVLEKQSSEIKSVIPVSQSINQFKSILVYWLLFPRDAMVLLVSFICNVAMNYTAHIDWGVYFTHSIHLPENQIRK
jgi:hypothetical protein